MAGYMTKLQGYVYDGAHIAAEKLQNGVFAKITTDGVKKLDGAADAKLRVAPDGKTTLWGMPALTMDVVSVGADEIFFVENEWDINDSEEYDNNHQIEVSHGHHGKAREHGEERRYGDRECSC